MRQQRGRTLSTEHEEVYHAASQCQAASLPLTPRRLHDQKHVCSLKSKKTGGFASQTRVCLRSPCMGQLSRLEGGRLIAFVLAPHGKDDSHPDVGKGTDRFGMTFALRSFALIVVPGPGFLLGTLPGKLVQSVAQRFTASIAAVGLGIGSALKDDRRGSSQRLQTAGIFITCSLIPNLRQQSRREPFSSTGQTAENRAVSVGQKKVGNRLVVCGNLLDKGQQLLDLNQHQAGFGARGDLVGSQMRLVQDRENLGSNSGRIGMPSLLQGLLNLLDRGADCGLWGGIGLQKDQGGTLLELGKQLQSYWIVRFETGGHLVDQAGLALDQTVLIAGQRFQFRNDGTIRVQAPQVGQLGTSVLGQQIGINRIRLGTGSCSSAINGFGMDRIHLPAGFQQRSDQQTTRRFDDASQLLATSGAGDLLKESIQLLQPLWAMVDAQRSNLPTTLVDHQGVVMGIRPINACIPHFVLLSGRKPFLDQRVLILRCSVKARSSNGRSGQEPRKAKCDLA